ncbi:hypothetical protein Avbf_19068 [Armadillidium vulgare]|nr:hypothetical protein Avbf_19068 [Armadillidium vulgare]
MSPMNLVSSLSMLLLGARGSTADALSRYLKAEEFIKFNPHLLLKNITEKVLQLNSIGHECAFVNNIFVEEL